MRRYGDRPRPSAGSCQRFSTDDEPFFDRIRDVTCEHWHTDRIALIGDAAHAVHPISGMGASLALQDARVLAQELATSRSDRPSDAFAN
ncbi:NAD(P)/FAD-dependent oxidoreductase, partial [Halorubrum sp. SS7]|uniref:FAD-dependent oxidoreductase n=1 Tax=Halorubrum sp. SS7 TaxID=2518119 RepID=UPI001F5448C8